MQKRKHCVQPLMFETRARPFSFKQLYLAVRLLCRQIADHRQSNLFPVINREEQINPKNDCGQIEEQRKCESHKMSENGQDDGQNQYGQAEEDGLPGVEFDRSILVVRCEDEENDARYEPKRVAKSAGCILAQAARSHRVWPDSGSIAGPGTGRTSDWSTAIWTKASRGLASTIRTKCHLSPCGG